MGLAILPKSDIWLQLWAWPLESQIVYVNVNVTSGIPEPVCDCFIPNQNNSGDMNKAWHSDSFIAKCSF